MASARARLVQPMEAIEAESWSLRMRKLSHDANNALVPVYASLDMLRLQAVNDQPRLGELTARIEALRTVLMNATTPARRPPANAASVIPDTHVDLASQAMEASIALRWRATPDATLANPIAGSDLAQLLKMLVCNAFEAHAAAQNHVSHRWVSVAMWLDGGFFLLDVHDNGPGCAHIAKAARGELQRRSAGHLGLGLPMSAHVATIAGGTLHIESMPADGFRARVRVPLPSTA